MEGGSFPCSQGCTRENRAGDWEVAKSTYSWVYHREEKEEGPEIAQHRASDRLAVNLLDPSHDLRVDIYPLFPHLSHHAHVAGVHHHPHPGRSHLRSHFITNFSTEEQSSTASQTAVAISLVSRSCTWTRRMEEDTAGGQTCSLLLNTSTILASLERPSTCRGR